jgi:hypothetical protein
LCLISDYSLGEFPFGKSIQQSGRLAMKIHGKSQLLDGLFALVVKLIEWLAGAGTIMTKLSVRMRARVRAQCVQSPQA